MLNDGEVRTKDEMVRKSIDSTKTHWLVFKSTAKCRRGHTGRTCRWTARFCQEAELPLADIKDGCGSSMGSIQ